MATKVGRYCMAGALGLIALCGSTGCSSVHQIAWTRLDNAPCQTSNINAVWWSSETVTFCVADGRAQLVPTNHDDLGMLGGVAGLIAAIIGANL